MNMKDVKSIGARIAAGGKGKSQPAVDAAAIRELAELLAETGLTEIEIEQGGMRLRVARQREGTFAASAAAAPVAALGADSRRGARH